MVEDLKFVSDPLLFGRHIAELNATNNALVRSYVWGLDLSGSLDGAGGVGGLLWVAVGPAVPSGPQAHFCAYDGNGNVVALVSAADGSESARSEYGPFGEPIRVTGPAAANPFRFSTNRTDETADLVLCEYRAYSLTLGRWLSRDPIRDGRLHPRLGRVRETENPLRFARNDPAGRYDRLGLYVNAPPTTVSIPVSQLGCPRNCGPDVTQSIEIEFRALKDYLSGAPEFVADDPTTGQGNFWSLLIWFAATVVKLNWAEQLHKREAAQGFAGWSGCPSYPCYGTMTLCGRCVSSDVPGNVMFGYAARRFFPDWMRDVGAFLAEIVDRDAEFLEEDYDVFPLGAVLADAGSTDICTVLNQLPMRKVHPRCTPCSTHFFFFRSPSYPPYPVYANAPAPKL